MQLLETERPVHEHMCHAASCGRLEYVLRLLTESQCEGREVLSRAHALLFQVGDSLLLHVTAVHRLVISQGTNTVDITVSWKHTQ